MPDEVDTELTCDDGVDNDCDGDFDCFDADCAADDACACVPEPETCDNGTDDDCDGLIDCDDPDCEFDDACIVPPAPENDFCEDAIEIVCPEGGGDVTISGTTIEATFDDAGFCGTSNTAPGVWYKVSHDGLLTASTCNQANYDTKLSVYDGDCGALGCVTGNDDTAGCGLTSEVSWGGNGFEQLILVHGFSSDTGDFELTVTCAQAAENDLCEDAIGPLAVNSVTSGSTTTATVDEPPDIDCGTSVTAPGVWYSVIGTGNTMTASTCNDGDPATGGANYDTKISVYCADCEVKECIGGQDDATGCSGFSTQFSWPTNPGQTYKVMVHGFSSATGDFDLAVLDDGVPSEGGNDCDGVPGFADLCPFTVLPESVPTSGRLRANNSALTGISGIFETAPPNPRGLLFTTEDTGGCSCEQIVDALHLGPGQLRNGCSPGTMRRWLKTASSLSESLCGDCLIANGTPGCQNGDCEAAVCAVDSFCCDFFWDGICAGEAEDICAGGDLCIALPVGPAGPFTVEGGRTWEPEPFSKDPNYTPKE